MKQRLAPLFLVLALCAGLAAPALAGNVRKFPYVSNADGAACGKQDKSQSGTQLISFHGVYLPLLQFPIVP